jgi:hypothetical protein
MLPERVTQNNPHLTRLGQDITATRCHHRLSHLTLAIVVALLGYVVANLPRPLSHRSAVCLATIHIARLHQHLRTALRTFIVQAAKVQDGRHMLQLKCFPQPRLRILISSQP